MFGTFGARAFLWPSKLFPTRSRMEGEEGGRRGVRDKYSGVYLQPCLHCSWKELILRTYIVLCAPWCETRRTLRAPVLGAPLHHWERRGAG